MLLLLEFEFLQCNDIPRLLVPRPEHDSVRPFLDRVQSFITIHGTRWRERRVFGPWRNITAVRWSRPCRDLLRQNGWGSRTLWRSPPSGCCGLWFRAAFRDRFVRLGGGIFFCIPSRPFTRRRRGASDVRHERNNRNGWERESNGETGNARRATAENKSSRARMTRDRYLACSCSSLALLRHCPSSHGFPVDLCCPAKLCVDVQLWPVDRVGQWEQVQAGAGRVQACTSSGPPCSPGRKPCIAGPTGQGLADHS